MSAASDLLARLLAEPQRFAKYEVLDQIGRGGMGVVNAVRDRDTGRRLAMKYLDRARGITSRGEVDDHTARFLAEAQLTAQLEHPGIVPVHELGVDTHGRVWFTMKMVRGTTLTEVLAAAIEGRDGWNGTKVIGVLLRVCEALAFAHSRGVVHRDVKPDNVMVGRFGETYVMDWGLARSIHDPVPAAPAGVPRSSVLHTVRSAAADGAESPFVTADGVVVGTPSYMAPEQAEGRTAELDGRADVYAVGAILYQALTGDPPYQKPGVVQSPRTLIARVLAGPPEPVLQRNPRVPADLAAICGKAMARSVEQRYAKIQDLAADLEAFLDRRPIEARHPGFVHRIGLAMQRHRAVTITAALALLALSALGVWDLVRVAESRRAGQRVADLLATQALLEEARATLCARSPEQLDRSARWSMRADALLARQPLYRAEAAQGADPAPLSTDEAGALRRQLDELAVEHGRVAADIAFAKELLAPRSDVETAAWRRCLDALAREPEFAGLPAVEQIGLLPLGKNPAGRWQFLLLGTGEPPTLRADGSFDLQASTGIVLVLLPGGDVRLGFEHGESNEVPHTARLAPFLFAAHEVTQAQWMRREICNPSRHPGRDSAGEAGVDERHPVDSVNWYEAVRFATRCNGRLPSEAEFERAARAGSPDASWFDGCPPERLAGRENLRDAAHFSKSLVSDVLPFDDGFRDHAPVGSFRANSFGLFDVGGNVSEWTADLYTENAQAADAAVVLSRAIDRLRLRAIRGSNWGEPAAFVRASYRKFQRPDYSTHWLGFRLARDWFARR